MRRNDIGRRSTHGFSSCARRASGRWPGSPPPSSARRRAMRFDRGTSRAPPPQRDAEPAADRLRTRDCAASSPCCAKRDAGAAPDRAESGRNCAPSRSTSRRRRLADRPSARADRREASHALRRPGRPGRRSRRPNFTFAPSASSPKRRTKNKYGACGCCRYALVGAHGLRTQSPGPSGR